MKARHDYNIEDTIGRRIVLQGTEIKSILPEVVLTPKIVMPKLKTVKCI